LQKYNRSMIIYNVTINIDESVEQKWLNWMKTKHIQEVLQTNLFTKAVLIKVLIEEEMGGSTYSIQYFCENKEKLNQYYQEFAPKLRKEGLELFGDKMLAFRTELQILEEIYHEYN
jgi:Domain of unknown function (DUF4286)